MEISSREAETAYRELEDMLSKEKRGDKMRLNARIKNKFKIEQIEARLAYLKTFPEYWEVAVSALGTKDEGPLRNPSMRVYPAIDDDYGDCKIEQMTYGFKLQKEADEFKVWVEGIIRQFGFEPDIKGPTRRAK